MKEKIKNQPLWVQRLIEEKDAEIARLRGLESAHDILRDREWFTIYGPDTIAGSLFPERAIDGDSVSSQTLFVLSERGAFPVVSIYKNDCLIVGRDKKRTGVG